jgi:hypothetical protein
MTNHLRPLYLLDPDVVPFSITAPSARRRGRSYETLTRRGSAASSGSRCASWAPTLAEPSGRGAPAALRDLICAPTPPMTRSTCPTPPFGVNVVARSLRLGRGATRVLATDHEYGACDNACGAIMSRERGFALRAGSRCPLPLDHGRPRSWSTSGSGVTSAHPRHLPEPHHLADGRPPARSPPSAPAPRAAGILTLVDGAHAPGQIAARPAGHRRRLLHRQLPQMAQRAQRRSLPLHPTRGATPHRATHRRLGV